MAIRLGNSCLNCSHLIEGEYCTTHQTTVSNRHTCDSFEMRASLKDDPNCTTCSRYQGPTCANPQKAAPGMLCSHWAPIRATA
ncbi:hypothetical protein ACJRPK_15225 [Aquimarina sp. 2-A2]|uniref:Uncharacterized protein n=1 Tax=Aquimarina intermedia TaxID=350814 RepID=A0A5S5CBF7_9FLAO|nr:hypothetical protein [Aquimarina intermedia]TYP75842.1 hypothetical protein BD809_10249 [Aquimarina intermedia]